MSHVCDVPYNYLFLSFSFQVSKQWPVMAILCWAFRSVSVHIVFLLWWRAPQQMLQTHRSIEAYCATPWWRWLVFSVFPCNGTLVEWNWQGKTCSSATFSTKNPTWTDSGSNPVLRGERPANNPLSHGTTFLDLRHLCSKRLTHTYIPWHGCFQWVRITVLMTYHLRHINFSFNYFQETNKKF